MSAGRLAIGAVAGAHGVKGQFKVKPFTAAPRDIASYGPVWAGARQLTLTIMGMTGAGLVIVKAAGISDRDSAAALRGTTLEVDRAAFPDADGDEVYHADLIGLAVETVGGETLGRLVALHDFGAGEIAEVKPEKGPTLMLPFDAECVPDIDLAAGRLVVDPPDGLLDGLLDGPDDRGNPERSDRHG